MNDYRAFAGSVLWQLLGVRETRTYAVMEEVKNSTHLHLLRRLRRISRTQGQTSRAATAHARTTSNAGPPDR